MGDCLRLHLLQQGRGIVLFEQVDDTARGIGLEVGDLLAEIVAACNKMQVILQYQVAKQRHVIV